MALSGRRKRKGTGILTNLIKYIHKSGIGILFKVTDDETLNVSVFMWFRLFGLPWQLKFIVTELLSTVEVVA